MTAIRFARELWDYALNVRDGIVTDDAFLPVIFAADPEDDWKDPASWHKAHPGVKARVLATLETRARHQGLSQPRQTAEAIFLFLEGVWASVRMFGAEAPLAGAETAVRRLFV